MQIGLIGLGKMGYNLALNLSDNGHSVVGTDAGNVEATSTFEIVPTLEDVVNALESPRVVWAMVPAGDITKAVLAKLLEKLEPGDIVIDGGNSNYKLSVARAEQFAEKQIAFFDCGTSGGTEGARNGACTMVGGDADAWPTIEPNLQGPLGRERLLVYGPSRQRPLLEDDSQRHRVRHDAGDRRRVRHLGEEPLRLRLRTGRPRLEPRVGRPFMAHGVDGERVLERRETR